mmetsp:Transcript_65031/g.180856  ORF Transcript_65031/g.180856 Transcript_65031/m.180856 type:complete len:107 (+) Transcript_65031:544-864(+)
MSPRAWVELETPSNMKLALGGGAGVVIHPRGESMCPFAGAWVAEATPLQLPTLLQAFINTTFSLHLGDMGLAPREWIWGPPLVRAGKPDRNLVGDPPRGETLFNPS